MTLALPKPRELFGVSTPRIAPPTPAASRLKEYEAAANEVGITLYPWQKIAARYITAVADKRWQYREICIVVARQNGKTKLLVPRILMALRDGGSILHTAQNRDIARNTFLEIAPLFEGLGYQVRRGNGQEEITSVNRRGRYKLLAPNGSARGETADLVVLDEVREQKDSTLLDALVPTTAARPNAQIIYLSNAGFDESVILNELKRRADLDEPRYAYLEWSARAERKTDDVDGWLEANPAAGHGRISVETLAYEYKRLKGGPGFETEYLCRWFASPREPLVGTSAWQMCHGDVSTPDRPAIAFNMAPDGSRASAAMAWQMADGRIALVELKEAYGSPIEVDALGPDLKALTIEHRARQIGFASWTDAALARHLPRAKAIDGKDYATASGLFAQLVTSGRLVWSDAQNVTEDLAWTSRKPHDSGAWTAVPAAPERSVTAALAAIRAVYLASAPKSELPRIG
jgi:hypothetical protein